MFLYRAMGPNLLRARIDSTSRKNGRRRCACGLRAKRSNLSRLATRTSRPGATKKGRFPGPCRSLFRLRHCRAAGGGGGLLAAAAELVEQTALPAAERRGAAGRRSRRRRGRAAADNRGRPPVVAGEDRQDEAGLEEQFGVVC